MTTVVTSQKEPKILLCSKSSLKREVIENLASDFNQICGMMHNPEVVSYPLSVDTPEQPFTIKGTKSACLARLDAVTEDLKKKQQLDDYVITISLENGIYRSIDESNEPRYYDICVMAVETPEGRYINKSFGIQLDTDLFKYYDNQIPVEPSDSPTVDNRIYGSWRKVELEYSILNESDSKGTALNEPKSIRDRIVGYDKTFGSFLADNFKCPSDNWMGDRRFGGIDRRVQIQDVCNKFLIDFFTRSIDDYPKPGVRFKDMTTVLTNNHTIKKFYHVLETFISRNYDLNTIDYFVGLESRGYYFSTHLANRFNKGMIPLRKAEKAARSPDDNFVSKKYGTEYSNDEFGLVTFSEYKDKNVIVLDDLLATGGSLVGASDVLKEAGLNVVSCVTMYYVKPLYPLAMEKLRTHGIDHRVILGIDSLDIPFKNRVPFYGPEVAVGIIRETTFCDFNQYQFKRKYTMSETEWMSEPPISGSHDEMKDVKVLFAEKDKDLAGQIIENINLNMRGMVSSSEKETSVIASQFSNGETRIKINTSIRKRHTIIVSRTRTKHINDDLMELYLIMDACNRSGAKTITVVLPYYPYARSDKKDDNRCPIGAAMIADFLKLNKVSNLISLDLHAGQIQGFVKVGFHNLYIKPYVCEYIYQRYLVDKDEKQWNDKFVFIAPDAGAARAIKSYSKKLGINNVVMDKERDYSKPGTVLDSRTIGSKDQIMGRIAFIIDDIGDTFGTVCSAARELVANQGAQTVVVFVTHGVLSGPAINRINGSPHISKVIVSDSLPQSENLKLCPKLEIISCAELIARTINGLGSGRSISRLFD